MVKTQPRLQDELDHLARDLDAAAAAARPGVAKGDETEDGARKRRRRPFRTECVVHCLPSLSSPIVVLHARTRNISEGGLGLLIKRVILKGTPLEVVLQPRGSAPIHFAGTAAFCRYAGRGFHEVGVHLRAYGPDPIFMSGPAQACLSHPWFLQAYQQLMP